MLIVEESFLSFYLNKNARIVDKTGCSFSDVTI